jgi:hypothetical protein
MPLVITATATVAATAWARAMARRGSPRLQSVKNEAVASLASPIRARC